MSGQSVGRVTATGGPTTAAELLLLAQRELTELSARAEAGMAPAEQLATAWPAFQRAAEHLRKSVQLEGRHSATRPAADRDQPELSKPLLDGLPDPQLLRASDLLKAAGDLLSTRERRGLTPPDAAVDLSLSMHCAVTGAVLVARSLAPQAAWVNTASSAAAAARFWAAAVPATLPTSATSSLSDVRAWPPAPLDARSAPDLLEVAISEWRRIALEADRLPAPSSRDLREALRAAKVLLSLPQALLKAYAPEAGSATDLERTSTRIRDAWRAVDDTATHWKGLTTATAGSARLLAATTTLFDAVAAVSHDGPAWASSAAIRSRMPAPNGLRITHLALSAVQDVAEGHAPVVDRLTLTGAVYTPARNLDPSLERLNARLSNDWLPIPASHAQPLRRGYEQVVATAAAAKLTYLELGEQRPALPPPSLSDDINSQLPPPRPGGERRPETLALGRWDQLLRSVDPSLVEDPHYPALAAALDRVQLSGHDAPVMLAQAAAQALDPQHPARALHYRLIDACPAALTPYTNTPPATRPKVHTDPAPRTRPPVATRPR